MEPRKIIDAFDAFLAERGLAFHAVVIGGAALALLGVIKRETRDCDVLDPEIPEPIKHAARDFAAKLRNEGQQLADEWLNNGPSSLVPQLPKGWEMRLQPVFRGKAITLETLGREDLLRSKLFAYCDRSTDFADCVALQPTREELDALKPWVQEQDGNPDWPRYVDEMFAQLSKELGHVQA